VAEGDPTNADIARALDEVGDLYELDGAVSHRVLAYHTGAQSVRESSASVAQLAREGRATELPGIGATLQEKILALTENGEIPAAVELHKRWPAGVLDVTRLPGIGAKRARLFYTELGIASTDELRAAAENQALRHLKGVGPKMEEAILQALERRTGDDGRERILASRALAIAEEVAAALEAACGKGVRATPAGSVRRRTETVADIDMIATGPDPAAITRAFCELDLVERAESSGELAARVVLHSGTAVDLRVGDEARHGNLLQHFTGSAAHNTALRERAVKEGLHVSEYGIRGDRADRLELFATEAEVYRRLGMDYIEPELRENRGELDAAREGTLPALVSLADLRGDLHTHTTASDGQASIAEMAAAAKALGHEYLAITDHSATHGFGNDVSPEQLERQIELVREANERIEGIELLAGSEVNILPDGKLDYADDLLARLDWVVASIHTAFKASARAMTDRMLAAIGHPLVDAIGHPTGRLIGKRPPYELELGRVFAAAAETGTALEINSSPNRRDLSEIDARAASQAGVRFVIDSDAHREATLANLQWGVATARRAWLGADAILNALPLDALRASRPRARG